MNPHISYYLPFLGHHVMEESLGMGEWGDSIYVAWCNLFPCSALWDSGVYLALGIPIPLTYLHTHQALPTEPQPSYKP